MGVAGGPDLIQDGLILDLDASDRNSYVSGSTTWFDLSGLNNSGSLINGPTFSTGSLGSIVFDGVDDYVAFQVLPSSIQYTVSCWFTTNTGNWNGALFGFGTGDSPNTQDVYLFGEATSGCSSPTGGSFGFNTWNCDSWGIGNASALLKGTGYHHVVATFNHQNLGNNKLWLDSVEQTLTQQVGTTNFSANLQNQFKISANGWYTDGQLWKGTVASCQVYNRALTPSEILQNYNATKTRFGL